MKLHLPKLLLTAVLAACAVGQLEAKWAADARTNAHWYFYDEGVGTDGYTNIGTDDDPIWQVGAPTGTNAYASATDAATNLFWCSGKANGQTGTIDKMVLGNGYSMTIIQNPWQTDQYFSNLEILLLDFGENGGGAFNVAQTQSIVNVAKVSGALTAVNNTGTLTIGTADGSTTFGGTITNTGTMSVHGAINVTNIGAFTMKDEGTTSWSDATNSQGFRISEGATYILSTGGVQYDAPETLVVNDNGTMRDVDISDGLATFQGGSLKGTTYYVINADVTAGAEGTAGATAYDVANGRTLTINSSAADGLALNLQAGSTVSISNANREFTSSSLAHNVIIGDGGVVKVSGCGDWGEAYIRGTVDVLAGGKLKLDGKDSAGWSEDNSIKTINMEGSSAKQATVELIAKQTLMTNINMKGNALMSNGGEGALEFFGGKITAEGKNNEIAGNIMARGAKNNGDSYIEVKSNGELKITGDLTCNTEHYQKPGSIYKQGEGMLVLTGNNTVYNGFNVTEGTVEFSKGLTLSPAASEVEHTVGSLTVDSVAALIIGGTIYGTASKKSRE